MVSFVCSTKTSCLAQDCFDGIQLSNRECVGNFRFHEQCDTGDAKSVPEVQLFGLNKVNIRCRCFAPVTKLKFGEEHDYFVSFLVVLCCSALRAAIWSKDSSSALTSTLWLRRFLIHWAVGEGGLVFGFSKSNTQPSCDTKTGFIGCPRWWVH